MKRVLYNLVKNTYLLSLKQKQRIQVEKEPETCKEKSMEPQVKSEKSCSDQAVGKSCKFDTVNSVNSLNESSLRSHSVSNFK